MKKKKINALLAAGCVALLTPGMASAETTPIGDITDTDITTPSDGNTFSSITVTKGHTVNVDTTNGTLGVTSGATGTVSLGLGSETGDAILNLSPAIQAITFGKVTSSGTDDQINVSNTSTGSIDLGTDVDVSTGAKLTITNNGSGTMEADTAKLTGTTTKGATGGATLVLAGNKVVTLTNGINVTNHGNTIETVETANKVQTVKMNDNSSVTLNNVDATLDISTNNASADITFAENSTLTNDLTVSTKKSLGITATTTTEIKGISLTAGGSGTDEETQLTLNATDANITQTAGKSVELNGNSKLTTTNGTDKTVTLKNLAVSGENNTVTHSSGTNLGEIALGDNSKITFANGISKTTNYTSINYTGKNTINVQGASNLSGLTLENTATNTHDVIYNNNGTGTLTTGDISLTGYNSNKSQLTLNAASADITVGTDKITSLNGATLNMQGANAVNLGSVSVTGSGNEISNTDAGTRTLGAINLTGTKTDLTVTNIASGITGIGFSATGTDTDANKVVTNGSALGILTFGDDATKATVENTNADTGSTFTSATVGSGQTLTLSNAVASTLSGKSVTMTGGKLSLSGAGVTSLSNDGDDAEISVSGTGNTIEIATGSTNTNKTLGQINLTGSTKTDLTVTNVASGITGIGFSATGTDTDANKVVTNGSALGILTFNTGATNATVENASTATTSSSFTSATVGSGQTLTLKNSSEGSQLTNTNANIYLNGTETNNATLQLAGNDIIEDGKTLTINAKGENNVLSNADSMRNNMAIVFDKDTATNKITVDSTAYALTFNGVTTGTDTDNTKNTDTIINKGANSYTTLTVNANDTLTLQNGVENTDTATATFTTANIVAGTTGTSNLSLYANKGNIEGTSVTLNGNAKLDLSGSNDITITDGVTATGTGNTIANAGKDRNMKLAFAESGDSSITIDGSTKKLTFANGISTSSNATVNNDTIINKGTNSYTTLTVNANDSLTLQTDDTATATFTTANIVAGTTGTSNLSLYANKGNIEGTSVTLNGNAKLDLAGEKAITLSGVDKGSGETAYKQGVYVTGEGNSITDDDNGTRNLQVIELNDAAKLTTSNLTQGTDFTKFILGNGAEVKDSGSKMGDITVEDGDTNNIIATGGETTFGTATLGTSSTLNLKTEAKDSGTANSISGTKVDMGNGSILAIGETEETKAVHGSISATTVNLTNTASGTNTITDNSKGSTTLSTVNYQANSTLTVNSTNSNTTTTSLGTVYQSGENTLNLAKTADITNLNTKGTDKFTVNATGGTATIETIARTSGDDNKINLELNANGGDISVTNATTLGDGDSLTLKDSTSKVKLTTLNVATTGTNEASLDTSGLSNTTSTVGNINLNGATLNATQLTNAKYTSLNIKGTNTINMNASTLGDLTLDNADSSVDNLTLANTSGTNSFANATLTGDSTLSTAVGGTKVTLTASNLNLNGSSLATGVDVNAGKSSITLTDTANAGEIKLNAENASVDVKGLTATNHTLNIANKGTINSIDNNELASIPGLEKELTIKSSNSSADANADKVTTTLSDFSFGTSGVLNLNAGDNSTISYTKNSIEVNSGNTLTTSGEVKLAGISVNGGNVQTSDETVLNNMTIATKLDTTGNGATNTNVNGTLNVVTTPSTPQWDLDVVVDGTKGNVTVATDKLTGVNAVQENGVAITGNSQLLDLDIQSLTDTKSLTENTQFVKYVQLTDATNDILKTVYDSSNNVYYKQIGTDTGVYYSYINPSDTTKPADYGSYQDNTIRITNYNIGSDYLSDYLTQQGTRTYSMTGGMQTVRNGDLVALPNMEARSGIDNVMNFKSVYSVTGYNFDPTNPGRSSELTPDNRAQLFTLNTTDGINRTMNMNGIIYRDGYSYDQYSSGTTRQDNTGLGAALHVESNTTSGNANVNLGSETAFKRFWGWRWNGTEWESYETKDAQYVTQNPEFMNNEAKQLSTDTATTVADAVSGFGGAIYSTGEKTTIQTTDNNVSTTFTNNKADRRGGAIYNTNGSTIKLTGDNTFTGNMVGTYDGASTWSAGNGGAIYNTEANLTLGNADATLTFSKNEALGTDGTDGHGGAIASVHNDANFYGTLKADGNASSGNGGFYYATDNSTVNIEGNQTFTKNTATGKGGAIYADKKSVINITANSGNTVFKGNKQDVTYTVDSTTTCGHALDADGYHVTSGGDSNAIYLDNATLNLKTTGQNKITFNDKIANNNAETENSTITQKGNVYYNNDMSGYNGTFNLAKDSNAYFQDKASVPFAADYILNGGSTMWLNNGTASSFTASSLDLTNTSATNPANLVIDMDLGKELADRFDLGGSSTSGYINISGVNKIGETTKDSIFFDIAKGANVETSVQTMASDDPAYEYHLLGTSQSGLKSGLLLNRVSTYTTSLLGPQVAANARLASQLDTYQQLLHRVDEIAENRYFYAKNKTNLYAADPNVIDDRKIDNGYTPYVNQQDGGNLWVKPDFTLENINPEGLHGYSNKAYNTFVGYETPIATMKNGWDLINTVFGGYQGSYQSWDTSYNYQNGGSAGYMANLYHKNFFTGGVVMMGASAVNNVDDSALNRSMNFGLFDIGGGARVGYNIGMGKHWLFQPLLTASYIYISGVDKHNNRGERLQMKGTNTFQIAPGFKIIGNYGTWKPYLLCDYTWPIIAKTAATYNDVNLPDLRLKSYLEYGVGIRKDMGERFTGHLEAVMRNGGRTGVSFQGGLLFKF